MMPQSDSYTKDSSNGLLYNGSHCSKKQQAGLAARDGYLRPRILQLAAVYRFGLVQRPHFGLQCISRPIRIDMGPCMYATMNHTHANEHFQLLHLHKKTILQELCSALCDALASRCICITRMRLCKIVRLSTT